MKPDTTISIAAEEQLRLLTELIKDCAFVLLNERGEVATWNQGAEQLLGWTSPEVIGSKFDRFFTPDDVAAKIPEREFAKARSADRVEFAGWCRRKDGTQFWSPTSISRVRDSAVSSPWFALVIRNVDERLTQQRTLSKLEPHLASIIDSIKSGIVSLDACQCIIVMNAAAESIFGYRVAELLGQPVARLLCDTQSLTESLRAGKSNVTLVGRKNSGKEFPVEASISRHEVGGLPMFTLVFRDISESIATETARRQAEQILRDQLELRERLTRIASTAPGVICSFRLRSDGHISFPYASSAIENIYGLPADALATDASPALQRIHPDEVARVINSIKESARTLTDWKAEFRVINPSRGELWIEGHSTPETEPDGSVLWHGFLNDVTKRKQADAKLRESEENFRQVVETIQEVFWIQDAQNQRMHYISPAYERIWGRSAKELYDNPNSRLDHVHPGDRARVQKEMAQKLTTGEYDLEYRIVRPDGTLRWIHESAFPVRDASGRPSRIVGAAEDITRRKSADRYLRLQSAALNAAANAIFITDRNGIIEWVNGAFTELTGYTFAEALGHPPSRLINSSKQDEAFYRNMWNTIAAGQVWRGELINRRKDGSLYNVVMIITPLRDEHGSITHFISISEDITERKKLEAQLLRTQRLESVGRLAGGIAHDLNNILVPMLMSPPILREAIPDPNIRELVDTIEAGAKRGAEIIRQLLTFSRGADGQRLPVQLSALTGDMAKIARETFPKNIKTMVHNTSGLWLVNGDATQIHQVLMNLCVNAADAMPDGGILTLGTENIEVDAEMAMHNHGAKPGRHVLLTVIDTGKGIPPEHLDQIFDPFFTTKEVGRGTGLGLSTVLGIVTAHGGFMQVESKVGTGTCFRIYLPSCDVADTREADTASNPTPSGNNELILIVDDEDSVRSVTRRLLERHGYRVLEANEGGSGIATYAEHQQEIALVLVDYLMPGMDGQKFLHALREADADAKVIAISGHLSEAGLPEELSTQVQAFIPKPFTAAALLQTVHRVMHPN